MRKTILLFCLVTLFPGITQAKFNYLLWTQITVELGSIYMMAYHKDVPPNPYAPTKWSYTELYGNAKTGPYWTVRGAGTVTNLNNYEWSKNSQFNVSFYDGEAKQQLLYSKDITFRYPIEAGGAADWDTQNIVLWDDTTIEPKWAEITLLHAGSPYDYMDKDDGQLVRVFGAAIFVINTWIMVADIHAGKLHVQDDNKIQLAFNYSNDYVKLGATKRF